MFGYVFWHIPADDVIRLDYESALVAFHRQFSEDSAEGFLGSASYEISGATWLPGETAYEDWYFTETISSLETLNAAVVKPERWDAHASISYKTELGYGGLYYRLNDLSQQTWGSRCVWMKRPKRIRYEVPLSEMMNSASGVVSYWRKFMVLGPADEFVVIGDETLHLHTPPGWSATPIQRRQVV